MKYLSFATLMIMAIVVSSARADISVRWQKVEAGQGTPESDAINLLPADETAWQLVMTTDTSWIGSNIDVRLDPGPGQIVYAPAGNADRSPPGATTLFFVPSAIFTTHFSGTHVDEADAPIPGNPPVAVRRAANFTPDPVRPGGKGKTYTPKDVTTTWFTKDPALEEAGEFVIGMLVLTNDAQGSVVVDATDPERAAKPDQVPPVPPNPFIFEQVIVDGQIIPEPSTALLAIVGLMGLLFGAARRRRRQA